MLSSWEALARWLGCFGKVEFLWKSSFLFAGFAWTLWITRNKMAIENVFPKAPTDVIYTAVSLMQRWCVLLKEKDRERIMQVLEAILNWLKNLRPNSTSATDVFGL